MSYTFDGANKLVILNPGTLSFTAQDVYSRWKEWVLEDDNSKYEIAFRSVAGDPISATQVISPYIFLNTTAGWRIRPQEASHSLSITGNLYSDDPDIDMFIPTLGGFTVTVTIDRSAAAITTSVGGGTTLDEYAIRNAMTAQGYTPERAPGLDFLDAAISTRAQPGQGLTEEQSKELEELFKSTVLASGEIVLDVSDPRFVRTDILTSSPSTFVGCTMIFEFIPSGRRRARVIRSHDSEGTFELVLPVAGLPVAGTKVMITSEWNNIVLGRVK